MRTAWALQDAKNRFSEVVEVALREGPQTVTRRGTPVVMIVSVEEYKKKPEVKESIWDVFKNVPVRVELDISRDPGDTGREVEL